MYSFHHVPYAMRDPYKLELYKFKTVSYGYKSLKYAGAKLWNSLPVNFKESINVNSFKVNLLKWKCNDFKCIKCKSYMYHS